MPWFLYLFQHQMQEQGKKNKEEFKKIKKNLLFQSGLPEGGDLTDRISDSGWMHIGNKTGNE